MELSKKFMNALSIYFFHQTQHLKPWIRLLTFFIPLFLAMFLFKVISSASFTIALLKGRGQGRPVDSIAHVLILSVLEEQVLLTRVNCVEWGAWAQVFLCYRNGSSLTHCALQITFIDHQLLNQKLYHSLLRLFFSISSSLENQLG